MHGSMKNNSWASAGASGCQAIYQDDVARRISGQKSARHSRSSPCKAVSKRCARQAVLHRRAAIQRRAARILRQRDGPRVRVHEHRVRVRQVAAPLALQRRPHPREDLAMRGELGHDSAPLHSSVP